MLERLLKVALEAELALLAAQPRRLELFLRYQNDLSDTEIVAIIEYFLAHPAQVVINYPRNKEPKFPLYAIILAEERETQPFLGDTLGLLDRESAEELDLVQLRGSEIIGYLQSARYHIRTLTEENPDLTLYYYQIAKAAIFRRYNSLKAQGIYSINFSGRDFQPSPDYTPANLFVRDLTLEIQSTFSIIGDIPDDYFESIDGIYVRDEPPIRGVLANVTVIADPNAGEE